MDGKRGVPRRKLMTQEEIEFLKKLVDSLEDSQKKLERFYKKRDSENLDKTRGYMLQIHDKISELLR